jgi:hypothetical protein
MASASLRPRIRREPRPLPPALSPPPAPPPQTQLQPPAAPQAPAVPAPATQPALLSLDDAFVLAFRVAGEPRAEIAELSSLPPPPSLSPPAPEGPPQRAPLAPAQAALLRAQVALSVAEEAVRRSMARSVFTMAADACYFVVIYALAAASPDKLGLDDASYARSGLVIGIFACEIAAAAVGLLALRHRLADVLGAYAMAQLCLTLACLRTIYFGWPLVLLRSMALVTALHMRLLLTARHLLASDGARSLSAEATARHLLTSGSRHEARELQRTINAGVAELMLANDVAERARASSMAARTVPEATTTTTAVAMAAPTPAAEVFDVLAWQAESARQWSAAMAAREAKAGLAL